MIIMSLASTPTIRRLDAYWSPIKPLATSLATIL
jgi:hypothetical protein